MYEELRETARLLIWSGPHSLTGFQVYINEYGDHIGKNLDELVELGYIRRTDAVYYPTFRTLLFVYTGI